MFAMGLQIEILSLAWIILIYNYLGESWIFPIPLPWFMKKKFDSLLSFGQFLVQSKMKRKEKGTQGKQRL